MSHVRQAWLVARRDVRERSRSRAFRVSLVLMVLIAVSVIVAPKLLGSGSDTKNVGLTGVVPTDLTEAMLSAGEALGTPARVRRFDTVEEGSERVVTRTSTSWWWMGNGWSGVASPTSSYVRWWRPPSSRMRCGTGPRQPASVRMTCAPWSRRCRSKMSRSGSSPAADWTTRWRHSSWPSCSSSPPPATVHGAVRCRRGEDESRRRGAARPPWRPVSFAAVGNPDTAWAVLASYLPPTAPLAMPNRFAMGATAWWEPFVAAATTAEAIAGLVYLGGRIYQNAILRSGPAMSLRDAWRGTGRVAPPRER